MSEQWVIKLRVTTDDEIDAASECVENNKEPEQLEFGSEGWELIGAKLEWIN